MFQIPQKKAQNTSMSKKLAAEKEDDQPYDSMSDPEIETDEKRNDLVSSKVLHTHDDELRHALFFVMMTWFVRQKKQTHPKKAALTRNDVQEKITKCKINRQRLDLRFASLCATMLARTTCITDFEHDTQAIANQLSLASSPEQDRGEQGRYFQTKQSFGNHGESDLEQAVRRIFTCFV